MSNHIFDRNPSPKRRKFKDNPYTIFTVGPENDLHYYLSFVDNRGVSICMEINKQLFEAFDQFERDDLSYMNEMDRHYEHLEMSDISLWRRAVKSIEPIEDSIEREMLLRSALKTLTPTQRRRLAGTICMGFAVRKSRLWRGVPYNLYLEALRRLKRK